MVKNVSALPPNIICATSTVADGNMSFRHGSEVEVRQNREQFLAQHHILPTQTIPLLCTNEDTIVFVSRADLEITAAGEVMPITAEALITKDTDLALFLLTADCIPAAIIDPLKKVIALAHLNRHTYRFQLASRIIARLREECESNPKDLVVHFGPHIKNESYLFTLPLDTAPEPSLQPFITELNNAISIDLTTAYRTEFLAAGVLPEKLAIDLTDTATDLNYFSHYRASRDTTVPPGRMATILMRQS